MVQPEPPVFTNLLNFDFTGKSLNSDHEVIPITSWNVKSTLFSNDCDKCLCINHDNV